MLTWHICWYQRSVWRSVNVCSVQDSWQLQPVQCLLFSSTSLFMSWMSSSFFVLFFKNVLCLPVHTPCYKQLLLICFSSSVIPWLIWLVKHARYLQLNLPPPVHLFLPHFFSCPFPLSLLPSPSSIFGWFGCVSAQNNNNDHASMSVSIPAWLLQNYAAILQAERKWKACLCLKVEAPLIQTCGFFSHL